MARPKKNNADYFSHDADMRNDPKIKAVRKKFGLEGYAVWCMLLETLTHSDGFELDWDELSIELIAPDFDLDFEQLNEMVEYFCKLKLVRIEKDVLVCDKLIERFESLLAKRNRQRKSKIDGVSDDDKQVIASENPVSVSENPQSKVNKTKLNESIITPPPPAVEPDPLEEEFEKFWDYYDKKVDRKKAWPKWKKLTKDQKDKIRKHLPLYLKSQPDKQYRKNPLTYLNGECWNDEIQVRKPEGTKLPPPPMKQTKSIKELFG